MRTPIRPHAKHKAKSHSVHQCPPGLADKGCMPPGQAKKYQIGSPLFDGYLRLSDWKRFDLVPPPRGHFYARVDRDIILMAEATQNVIEIVHIIDLID